MPSTYTSHLYGMGMPFKLGTTRSVLFLYRSLKWNAFYAWSLHWMYSSYTRSFYGMGMPLNSVTIWNGLVLTPVITQYTHVLQLVIPQGMALSYNRTLNKLSITTFYSIILSIFCFLHLSFIYSKLLLFKQSFNGTSLLYISHFKHFHRL